MRFVLRRNKRLNLGVLLKVLIGELVYSVDIQESFENIPDTLNRLYMGKNLGKQLLKVGDPLKTVTSG